MKRGEDLYQVSYINQVKKLTSIEQMNYGNLLILFYRNYFADLISDLSFYESILRYSLFFQDYLDRKRKEQMLRKKKKVGMANTKLRARKMDQSRDFGNTSTTSIKNVSNPAAAGGLLGIRKFGMGAGNNKKNAY